jgi:signal transduction histidine kinase
MRERELIAPECEEVRALAEREFAEHGRTGLYKCSLVRKDGSRVPVIGGRALVTETGEAIKYFIDISPLVDMEEERSKLQQQLLQSEKVNALGQFASGVAHNFNNELSIIMGYGSVLEEQFGSDANSRRILQQMMKAAERSRNLIQQLLAFSRRQTTHPEIIDLNHAVSELKSTVRQVTRDSIDINVELSDEPEHIHADPALLEQALFNLAKNAGEAMPFGGTLTFSVAHEQLLDEAARISESAIVRVSDTGHGMEEETKKKIFEPFFTTKQQSGGTGLGLSTVYGFAKQSGGDIHFDSVPGRGTTFTLRFPKIRISAAPRVGAEKGEAVPKMNATVLLVEDNSELRQMMTEILSASGLTVIQAKDGFEALNRARSAHFDLVLTDVLMPGMNGLEVVDRIRETHPGVKVIFISGSADMVSANTEDLVMWKPVRPETLLRAVHTSLSNKASAGPRSRPAA